MSAQIHSRRWNDFGVCPKLALVVCMIVATPSRAQQPLPPVAAERANKIFDNAPKGGRLDCTIHAGKTFLDFSLRFGSGYVITCPLRKFQETGINLITLLRITPEGEAPVMLHETYKLPQRAQAMFTQVVPKRATISASGAFLVGVGQYRVEVLLMQSQTHRSCRKQWKINVHEQRGVLSALPPHTVAPAVVHPWDGKSLGSETGLRLTVLLNAAPLNPRVFKLRAWDRAFLMAALSSVLQQIPCKSVRLVVFNLDQQREVFRREEFAPTGLSELSQALQSLELGTVPVSVLQKKNGWAELLAGITNQEVAAGEPADAVVFLGPSARIAEKTPRELLKPREGREPQFFYLEYFPSPGSEFPDAIDYLTKARDGTTFKIHNAGEFAQAIQKMLGQLKRNPEEVKRGESLAPGSPLLAAPRALRGSNKVAMP